MSLRIRPNELRQRLSASSYPVNAPADFPDRAPFGDDELVALQLRIARRADQLARDAARDPSIDLDRWLQAERECLETVAMPPSSTASRPVA